MLLLPPSLYFFTIASGILCWFTKTSPRVPAINTESLLVAFLSPFSSSAWGIAISPTDSASVIGEQRTCIRVQMKLAYKYIQT